MKKISLSTKINGLCFSALMLIGVVTFVQFKWTNDSLIGKVRDKFQTDAQMLGTNLSTVLFERYYDVQAFASNKLLLNFQNKTDIRLGCFSGDSKAGTTDGLENSSPTP